MHPPRVRGDAKTREGEEWEEREELKGWRRKLARSISGSLWMLNSSTHTFSVLEVSISRTMRGVFRGQVISQALVAAIIVGETRTCPSCEFGSLVVLTRSDVVFCVL